MEGISDIRIGGIDESRPPMILKQPYIDLVFRLNHKAPSEWCVAFNDLMAKDKLSVKIEPSEGIYIETWVRTPEEIEPVLQNLKEMVNRCSEEYVERIEDEARAAIRRDSGNMEDEGEQGRLNRIVAGLKFDA
ncbi:MAG: hypothetical protein OEZ16_02310 [Chromatiales bacterium]|nr:hypothetical protein [Chromatiales bacterium]